jgi:hypothetical protein
MRIGRVWKAALLIAAGAVGGGAALAVASVPGSNGVIHGCYLVDSTGAPVTTGPNLRIIDPSLGQQCLGAQGEFQSESSLSWNQTGPPGPPGKSVTIAGGHTFTVGHTVVTVGFPPSEIVTPPLINRHSTPIGTLKLSTGQTFHIFSFDFAPKAASSGAGAGKVNFNEFTITKEVDKASPKLRQFCANGKHIPQGTITLRKAGGGGKDYLVIKFDTVIISSYQISASNENPTESLSLNFTKIVYEHK